MDDSPPNDSAQAMEPAPSEMNAARHSVVVKASIGQVYERWSRFEDLPRFIPPLRNVQRMDDTHFSFATRRDGRKQRGVIHIVLRVPERRIAWRTISDDLGLGVVSFEPRSGRTTEIALRIRSIFDPSTSSQRADEYLRNFKRLVENEETVS